MNPYAPGAAAMSRPGGVGASSLSRPGSAGVGASSSMSRPGSAGVGATSAGIVGGLTSSAAAKASSSLVGGLTSGAAAKATSSSGLVGGLGAAKASAGVVGGLTSSAASKASAGAVGGLTAGVGAKPSGIGVGGGLSSASAGVGSKSVTMGGVSSTSASSSLARPGSAGVGVGAKPGTSTGSTASPYGAKAPGTTGFGSTSPYSSMGGAKAGATVGSTSPYAGVGLSKAGAGVGVGGSSASATTATGLVAGAKVGSGVQSSASNPRGSVIISQLVDDSKARAGAGGVVTDPTGPSQMPMVQATAPMPPPEKQDAAASWLSKLDSYKAEEDQKKADIESLKVAKTPPQTTPRDDKKDEEDDLSPMSFAEKTGGSMKTTLGGPPQYGPKIPNIASFSVDALRRGSLHFYTYMGQYEHVDFLLKEADRVGDGFFVNATEAYGERTALHYACFQGEVEIANLLIEKGADLHARDKERRTPMHYACFRGATKIVRSMVGIAVHRLRADSNKKYRQLKLQAPGYDPEYGEEGGYERKCAAQCCLEYFKNIEDLRFKFLAGRA
ncbi:unnamed protein product [Amoebophrya sp. A25]|nr:unnamed protein product [Amoebophrya sp. A25]|eukprot:GSA25T00009312001.1